MQASRQSQRYGSWIAFVAGLLVPLAFAPFNFYLLLPVLLAVLFWLWDDTTPRSAAWLGWLFGFGAFLTGTHWLYVSLHVFGKAPLFLALVLMAALMAFMAAYTALLGFLVARFHPTSGAQRWLLLLPSGWVLGEWLRSWVLSGFPWLSLGYTTTDSALAGWIPLGGVFAASAAVALTAGALRTLVAGHATERLAAGLLIAAVWLAGGLLDRVHWTDPTEHSLRVSIVQGAVPQERKWLPEELLPTMRLYREKTREHWGSDLILWPEAAIPALRSTLGDYYDDLNREGQGTNTAIVLGIIEFDPETNEYFNGVLSLDQQQSIYNKRHLVPFGEYFPVPGFVREWMRLRNLPYSDYSAGDKDQAPLIAAGEKIAASICYEDVFGNQLRAMLPEATMLANVSNDAWFGESIAPDQHLQIARVRAIEAGRYLLRATNTGISAIIAPDGRVEATIPQFQRRVLTADAWPHTGATPYVLLGDRPIVLLSALFIILALAATRR